MAIAVFATIFASLQLSGCGSDTPTSKVQRIVIITNAVSPFWDAADIGAKNAEKDLKLDGENLRVDFIKNTEKVRGQIDHLKQLQSQNDVAAVAISVTDPGNKKLIAEMKKLRDQGVHVVTIDSDVDREKFRDARYAYLGTDNVVAGRELGRAAKGLLPEGGKYASFVGLKSQGNAIERNQGFKQGAGEKFEQVEFLGDDVDESVAQKNVRDALSRTPDLNLLVGIWSYNSPAIVKVVEQQGIGDKVKVVGFDAEPIAVEQMGDGRIDCLIVQNPYEMGYQSVRALKALLDEDKDELAKMFPDRDSDKETRDLYNTGLKVVVPGDDSPLEAGDFESGPEFLTLDAFQKWLEKYGLQGS